MDKPQNTRKMDTKHRTKTNNIELVSAVLTHGHAGQLPKGPTSIAVYANLCMLYTTWFF